MKIEFLRYWAMPNKNTFEINPVKKLLKDIVDDNHLWIDPYANKNKIAKITNDLNQKFDTNYHLDALDFFKLFENASVDGILFDPPYSSRQIKECYESVGLKVTQQMTQSSFYSNQKKEISRIVKKGGKVISFGWNSGGIGKKYGFKIEKIILVAHGGNHNDTIITIETKIHD